MPWWSWFWVAAMLAATSAGAVRDVIDREPLWYTSLGVGSGLACIVFVLNFFGFLHLGKLALPAVITFVALVFEAWRDVRADRELTGAQKALSIIITMALFAPAPVLGLLGSMG
ncbi:MAG: hypothetical protein OEM41_07710 [Ignavibacteria bacterium]|nr:hypothetical protein [Ignavibacteria bacterium]